MKKSPITSIVIAAALLLSACASAAAPQESDSPSGDTQPEAAPMEEYPAPDDLSADSYPLDWAYPEPDESDAQPQVDPALSSEQPPVESDPWSALPPAPEDAKLIRGRFFVDQYELQQTQEGTALYVEGSLPTPCNAPRAYASGPDQNNQITVELYSVVDPEMMCTQVIEPFTGMVANFAGIAPGQYQVILDGQPAGEFTAK